MNRIRSLLPAVCALLLISWNTNAQEPLVLKTMGSLFVGGEMVQSDAPCNASSRRCAGPGETVVGQARVDYLIPAEQSLDVPVIMIHGLGLSSALYLGTPSGGEGWAQHFARQGISAYAITLPSVVASGMDVAPFNHVRAGEVASDTQPALSVWTPNAFWSLFGYGPAYPQLNEGVKFSPEDLYGVLAASAPYKEGDMAGNQARDAGAIIALLEKIGPAVLMTHSLSGNVGYDVARQRPDLVKGVVGIEPADSCPADEKDLKEHFLHIPILTVYGDNLEMRTNFETGVKTCDTAMPKLRELGGIGDNFVLTRMGYPGHTHMMQIDRDGDQVAQLIVNWLQENVQAE